MTHRPLQQIKTRIAEAARAAGRQPGDVTLIAVSKTFGMDEIAPVIADGQTDFGENRVQEAQGKWPSARKSNSGLRLHLIGPLQSNKAAEAVALFDSIHSIDRPKIADAIGREILRQGRKPELFVQVNTGHEAQKAGVAPEEADRFLSLCAEKHGLAVVGLMCIPPLDVDPRPHFDLLAKIALRNGLKGLSMGMSGDFEAAISCGATHVRVGSAIFGHRPAATRA